MSIDEQMKYDRGLIFDDNSGPDQELVAADVKKWCKTHCPSDYTAVSFLEATPLKDVLQAMDIPIVDLSLDFNKLVECPIGTTNVIKPGDDRAWSREHNHGKFPVGTIIAPGSWRVSSVGGY